MIGSFEGLWADLPRYLGSHLLLSLSALAAGIAISVPLGIAAARIKGVAGPVLGIVGVLQTVPSIALLALMVPLLGGTIGFLPAFIALMLYSMLPILRNTTLGIRGIDAAHVEAARGVGMTPFQQLWLVELPLALPVIVGGIRTATVWVVGTATLATPVGATSLGNYIFPGLQTRNWAAVLFGCLAAAGLAILLDQLIRIVEVSLRERRARLGWVAGAVLTLVIIAGLVPVLVNPGTSAPVVTATAAAAATGDDVPTLSGMDITIGAKPFTEQYILADLLESYLAARGARVDVRENLGSTILYDALRENTVDIAVDYTGTLWATILKREAPIPRHAMRIAVAAYIQDTDGILTLGPLGFENAYGFATTRAKAAALSLTSIADLAAHPELTLGSDPEFFARPEWTRTQEAYGLQALNTRTMDATFMYDAVRDGVVDAIVAYTTDGRVAAYDLVFLDDPAEALPPYDAVLLLSPRAAANPALTRALTPLINAIDDPTMREANRRVDLERQSVASAARWLAKKINPQPAPAPDPPGPER